MLRAKYSDAEGFVTIRGLIVPSEWDEGGNITATAISTYFEEEYLIDQNPRGKELLAFLRQKVEVIGLVRTGDRGRKVITVEEYEVIRVGPSEIR